MPARAFPIKPFRCGVQLSAPSTGAHWRDTARRIEAHGYFVATMPDHFTPQLAPVPALQAVLDATSTLRAGAHIRTFFVSVTDDRSGAITRTAQMLDIEESMLDASPFALFGSPAKIVEDLLERREQFGFSYVVVGVEQVDAFAPVVAELAGR